MMTGGKYSLTPPRPERRPDPTPEDIAYVDRRLAEFRANLAVAERTPTTTRRSTDPRDLAAIQRGLGISATEDNREGAGWQRRCGVKFPTNSAGSINEKRCSAALERVEGLHEQGAAKSANGIKRKCTPQ